MTPLKLLLVFQIYSCCIFPIFFVTISAYQHKIPRLSAPRTQLILPDNNSSSSSSSVIDSKDYETYFYTQTLDHFNYAPQSYATFQQKYVINSKYWGGAASDSPIFAYLGEEAPLDQDLHFIGFLPDSAPYVKALLVYIEHRFYGDSVPFGTMEEAMKNETLRGYFNSAQAIADYAEVLLHVKHNLSAHYSPIIVIGGSYGGTLAAWFRLKYPHIALGALASSAPVLYFDNITPQNGYYSVVTKDFKEVSESCYETIRDSWSEIDRVASQPNGLKVLTQRFKTCSPLNKSSELKDFLDSMYSVAAQYDEPPKYPVSMVCKGIDETAPSESDIIGRIFSGVVSYQGNKTCYDTNRYNRPSETSIGWGWQSCSEMVVPIGRGENETMFPASPFDLNEFTKQCLDSYGVPPRPHWVTTYYGGHDIRLVLKRFGSNIIFSNGLRDPYSSGGVLEDLSESLLAVYTVNGSHCLDLHSADKTDPEWLTMQRQIEVKIIQGWIEQYNNDLQLLKLETNKLK